MNAREICLLLTMGIFMGAADAANAEPARFDAKPVAVAVSVSAQDGADVQLIRRRLAESCARNPDCSVRRRGNAYAKAPAAYEPSAVLPSTIERRRALGLKDGPARLP